MQAFEEPCRTLGVLDAQRPRSSAAVLGGVHQDGTAIFWVRCPVPSTSR